MNIIACCLLVRKKELDHLNNKKMQLKAFIEGTKKDKIKLKKCKKKRNFKL